MKAFEEWWNIEEEKPPWADRKLVAKSAWEASREETLKQVLDWIKEEDAISHLSEVRDKIEIEISLLSGPE